MAPLIEFFPCLYYSLTAVDALPSAIGISISAFTKAALLSLALLAPTGRVHKSFHAAAALRSVGRDNI